MALLSVEDVRIILPNVDPDRAQALIDDAIALAVQVAPCLADDDLDAGKAAAAKAILRQVVARWVDRGSGITTQESVGPFQWTQDLSKGNLFWPSEIQALQSLCGGGASQGQVAFSVDMAPDVPFERGYWVTSDLWIPGY